MIVRESLIELLSSHNPVDAGEAEHRRRMLELATSSADPFARSHWAPGHFTASAFVLSPDNASLLLILHGKLHLWLQPGGHIEPTDLDVFAAARREVTEETGISDLKLVELGSPLLDLDIHPIPANPRKGEPAHEHFDVRVLFAAPSWEFAAGSDAVDARWVELGEVQDAGTDDSVLRAVRRIVYLAQRWPTRT